MSAMHYGQPVIRLRDMVRGHAGDVLVVALVVAALLELVLRRDATDAPRASLGFALPAIAALAPAVLGRHCYPFAGPVAFWLLAAAFSFVDGRLIPFPAGVFLLGMAAGFLIGRLRESRQAWIGLAIVIGSSMIIVDNEPDHSTSSFVFVPVLFAISWLAGFALQSRQETAEAAEARAARAERERETAARIAVAEERARVARELHDIVAHAVSVMVLQVGAVRHNLPETLVEPAEALRGVERTGRTALAEMRRLLGAMRLDGDDVAWAPQPGLESLETLLAEVGRAGLPVRLHVAGKRVPLPPAVDLSAYRIVQEGLTNALKHAHATAADVTLTFTPDELELEVRDDGRGAGASGSSGFGLVGIRERVKMFGGQMSAVSGPDGGFALRARLPLGVDSR